MDGKKSASWREVLRTHAPLFQDLHIAVFFKHVALVGAVIFFLFLLSLFVPPLAELGRPVVALLTGEGRWNDVSRFFAAVMLLWLIAYRLAQANAERVKKLEDELAERRAKDETTEKRQKRRDRLAELIYKGDGLLLVCDTEDPNAKYNEWRDEIMKYVREEFGATEVMLFDDLNMEMQTFRAAPVIKYQIEWGVISSDIQGLKALVKRYAD